MSAYDKLGLAMIPTAWKDGKLYSAIPYETISSNLVSNGTFDDTSYWTLNSANITISNGTCNFNQTSGSSMMVQSQIIDFKEGATYRIEYDIVNFVSGSVRTRLQTGVNTIGAVQSGNGTYVEFLTCKDEANRYFQFFTSNFVGSIDNVKVQLVQNGDFNFTRGSLGTRIQSSGLLQTITDNDAPRLDYTNQACPSLLLEPQRSNEILYSEAFSSWDSNILNPIVTSNFATSPDGSQNATKLTFTQSNDAVSDVVGVFSLGTTFTFSMYVKNIDSSVTDVLIRNSSTDFWSTINWSGSDISSVTSIVGSFEYKEVGDGWYRIYGTYTNNNDTVQRIRVRGDGSNNSYLVYGAQLEQGGYPTSYIPTNGSAVTRLADVCNNAGDGTIFNDAEGVLFLEARHLADESFDNIFRIRNSDGSPNYVDFRYDTVVNRIQMVVASDGVNSTTISSTKYNDKVYNKIALKYKQDDFALWINGEEVAVDSSGNTPNDLNEMLMFAGEFNAAIRQILYFNEALTDAELEALTSSNIDRVLKNYNRRGELLGATYESTHVKTKLNELF